MGSHRFLKVTARRGPGGGIGAGACARGPDGIFSPRLVRFGSVWFLLTRDACQTLASGTSGQFGRVV